MNAANEALLNEILADFEKTRDTFLDVQKTLQSLSGTAESPDKALTVTLDAQGRLTSVVFRGTGYRSMPPAGLAALIVETAGRAHHDLQAKASAAAAPMRRDGAAAATLDGRSIWDLLPGAKDAGNQEFFNVLRGGPASAAEPARPKPATRSGGTLDDEE